MCRKGENIRKRKDGRWEARYIKYRDPEGKIHYGSLYGKTYGEVKDKRNKKNCRSPRLWTSGAKSWHFELPGYLRNSR